MARFKAFKLTLTKNQVEVVKRLFFGEKMTRCRVRFIHVRGCSPSNGTYDYANGDKAPYSAVESLKDKGIIKEERTHETLIFGYHDYTYLYRVSESVIDGIMASFTPTGKSLLNYL